MLINELMDLHHLAEHMGRSATLEEARYMRVSLNRDFRGMDTADVPGEEWLKFLNDAVFNAEGL